jgi:uncharacterized membrane protein
MNDADLQTRASRTMEKTMTHVQTIDRLDNRHTSELLSPAPRLVLKAATIGSGLLAGLFYAYQVSIIPAFKVVDDVSYVTSFNAINDKIENGWFFLSFMGTLPLIAGALYLYRRASSPVTGLVAAGLVLNLVMLGVTAFGNIPLNDDLAEVKSVTPATAAVARADFEETWNDLNLIRTLAALGSFVVLTVAVNLDPTPHRRAD